MEKVWRAKEGDATKLDISYSLTSSLRMLEKLDKLKEINASKTQITDLSPLEKLRNLTHLDISDTGIRDLSPLAKLKNLGVLYVFGTPISDLSPLTGLDNLNRLFISGTQIQDISPLAGLKNLYRLSVSDTQITDLSPLKNLKNLTRLAIYNTKVTDLTPLMHLIEKGIEVQWENAGREDGIYVYNCPLIYPPIVIAQQGNEAILRYFRERERSGTIKIQEARLLLVGQGASGKTTLRRKLLNANAEMPKGEDTTRGIEVEPYEFKNAAGDDFTLQIWDFGGQNIQHYAHQFFMSDSSVYALLSNEREQNPNFQYWLNIIEMLGGRSPVLVVQNEIEGHYEAIKDKPAIRERFANVQEFHAVDLSKAATDGRFGGLRQDICHYAARLPHVGKEYPASFVQVRRQLQALSETEQYIPWSQFEALCREQGITDEALTGDYARIFHILGICLHFADDLDLCNYVFLRPKWIIDSLFELLYHELVVQQKGEFSKQNLPIIWNKPEQKGMHGNLLHLMENFELCYPIEGTPRYIVPQRLPAHEGGERWSERSEPEATRVLYRYRFMPKGMLTRLTCRLHRKIEGDHVWSDAVIFADAGARVYVREVYSENIIEINAAGSRKSELLNIVIDQLDDIHAKSNFANLRVDKLVPCPCPECARLEKQKQEPHFFKYDFLVNMLAKGRPYVYCEKPETNEVSVLSVLRLTGIRFLTKPMLEEMLAFGDVNKALQLMQEWFPGNREVAQHLGRLSVLEKEGRMGKLSSEEFLLERNRILDGVLKMLGEV